jgi:hypothetical protein
MSFEEPGFSQNAAFGFLANRHLANHHWANQQGTIILQSCNLHLNQPLSSDHETFRSPYSVKTIRAVNNRLCLQKWEKNGKK